jgi:hypothetical protein
MLIFFHVIDVSNFSTVMALSKLFLSAVLAVIITVCPL